MDITKGGEAATTETIWTAELIAAVGRDMDRGLALLRERRWRPDGPDPRGPGRWVPAKPTAAGRAA